MVSVVGIFSEPRLAVVVFAEREDFAGLRHQTGVVVATGRVFYLLICELEQRFLFLRQFL